MVHAGSLAAPAAASQPRGGLGARRRALAARLPAGALSGEGDVLALRMGAALVVALYPLCYLVGRSEGYADCLAVRAVAVACAAMVLAGARSSWLQRHSRLAGAVLAMVVGGGSAYLLVGSGFDPSHLVGFTVVMVACGLLLQGVAELAAFAAVTAVVTVAGTLAFAPPTLAIPLPFAGLLTLSALAVGLALGGMLMWYRSCLGEQQLALAEANAEASAAAARSEVLLALVRELGEARTSTEIATRLAAGMRALLGCPWTMVCRWDTAAETVRVAAASGFSPEVTEELTAIEFSTRAFPLLDVLRRGEAVNAWEDARRFISPKVVERYGLGGFIAVPLCRGGRIFAHVGAGHGGGAPPLTAAERRLAVEVAEHAAVPLEKAELLDQLQAANELKSEFLSTMSHELRTPLNVIVGYADLLREGGFGPLAEEQQAVVERLRAAATQLHELVNTTLDVGRLESGRMPVALAPQAVPTLLQEVMEEMRAVGRAPGVRLRCETPPGGPILHTDAAKLKMILKNLLGNALKFTPAGEVVLGARYDPVAAAWCFSVRDTGPGIPASELPRIFEMFHQGPASREQGGGVGLGLFIVERLTSLLGGRIEVESYLGEGSLFRLRLPVARAREREGAALAALASSAPGAATGEPAPFPAG